MNSTEHEKEIPPYCWGLVQYWEYLWSNHFAAGAKIETCTNMQLRNIYFSQLQQRTPIFNWKEKFDWYQFHAACAPVWLQLYFRTETLMCQNLFSIKIATIHYSARSEVKPLWTETKSKSYIPHSKSSISSSGLPYNSIKIYFPRSRLHMVSEPLLFLLLNSWYILCEILNFLSFNCSVILVELFPCFYLSCCWHVLSQRAR